MNIPQKIETIIQRRRQQLPEIEEAIKRIQKARAAVDRLDAFKNRLGTVASEFTDGFLAQLAAVSTDGFYKECEKGLAELNRLKARFSRNEVNISFVGRAGQGKSLVLQRISGLSGDVIPSSGGAKDCTGTRSIITNRPGEETSAEITFFTEQEFLDVVNEYLSDLFGSSEGKVTTINAISNLDKNKLWGMVAKDTVKSERMKHLAAYIDHAEELRDKLGKRIKVYKKEIERYVAQYSSRDPDIAYYDYLVVKEARIFAPFPYDECGKVVLVDTIGTGATSLGVDDEMMRTVREDSDAIILMHRPEPLRGRPGIEQFELLSDIIEEVKPEYADKMLFWLINRVEDGPSCNKTVITSVIDDLRKNENGRPVADYLNVNCNDEKDVKNSLLIPVLEQMSGHLDEIDQMIIDRANEQLAGIEFEYSKISNSIKRADVASISEDVRREFFNEIGGRKGIIGRLTGSLQDLFILYEKRKDNRCEQLEQEAKAKLKNILRFLPDENEILEALQYGATIPHEVLIEFADMLRLKIVNDFLGLNEQLDKLVMEMKREAVLCLADEKSGRLSAIVDADPDNPLEWLDAFKNNLDSRRFPMIIQALEPLQAFDLRMENFLIYKVRCSLKPIDWLIGGAMPPLPETRDKQALASDIQFHLRHNLEIIYKNVKEELNEYYTFPNTAMYAVLRDFYDRASRACDAAGKKVTEEWRELYENFIPRLWPEKYKACCAQKERSDEWNSLCDEIRRCAAAGYFKIR